MPGQTATWNHAPYLELMLQWRAGQLPGQTTRLGIDDTLCPRLQWRAGQLPGQTVPRLAARVRVDHASMEGRTIARPNPEPVLGGGGQPGASMEGRTIARPNPDSSRAPSTPSQCFNGGPDNCPAKQSAGRGARNAARTLQWRAGQLPGQTRSASRSTSGMSASFNGGPDNCPAKRRHRHREIPGADEASMEGRTIARPNCGLWN